MSSIESIAKINMYACRYSTKMAGSSYKIKLHNKKRNKLISIVGNFDSWDCCCCPKKDCKRVIIFLGGTPVFIDMIKKKYI